MIDTSTAQTQLVTLAPAREAVSGRHRFKNVQASGRRYDEFLAKLQRFRGRVYCGDGAISPNELTADGRHELDIDERSWHVVAVDSDGEVCGCVRYLAESRSTDFADLWIREAAIT